MVYINSISACYACKQIFSHNPMLGPSLTIRGTRERVCRRCIDTENARREADGNILAPIVPLLGTYDAV
jgi:hypothetical protein